MPNDHTAIAERLEELRAVVERLEADIGVHHAVYPIAERSRFAKDLRALIAAYRASADEVAGWAKQHGKALELLDAAEARATQAEAELERLNKALKYEQDRSDRIGTHGPGCFTWGHRHYDCALIENARLESELERLRAGSGKTELTADFVRALPGGKLDDATYEAIESALDKAEAPCQLDGRWLTLPERVSALQWDRDSLAKSFVESNREIRRIQAEADRASTIGEEGEGKEDMASCSKLAAIPQEARPANTVQSGEEG